jgi:hypothetical protein
MITMDGNVLASGARHHPGLIVFECTPLDSELDLSQRHVRLPQLRTGN